MAKRKVVVRNPVAQVLRTAKYRKRIVRSRKWYERRAKNNSQLGVLA